MRAARNSLTPQSRAAVRPTAGGTISGHRVLMGVLLVLIGIASVVGIVMTLMNGQTDAAIIIGIFSAAFFTRVGC